MQSKSKLSIVQCASAELAERKKKTPAIPVRETSSALMPEMRHRIEGSMRAGRDPKYVAADCSATQVLVVWVWARFMFARMERRLAALEDAERSERMRLAA